MGVHWSACVRNNLLVSCRGCMVTSTSEQKTNKQTNKKKSLWKQETIGIIFNCYISTTPPFLSKFYLLCHAIYQNSNSRNCHQTEWNIKITAQNVKRRYKWPWGPWIGPHFHDWIDYYGLHFYKGYSMVTHFQDFGFPKWLRWGL